MKVVFSDIAYNALLAETYEKIRTETGGVFLGCYDNGTWYIVETIDPGPKSIFRQDYFEYDQPYTAHLINKRARLYEHKLSLIGLWHRHPGSFDIFSSTDDGTNATYAKLSPEGAISILVNIDPVFRLSVFHVSVDSAGRPKYSQITYSVGDDKIPTMYRQFKSTDELKLRIDRNGIRKIGLWHYVAQKVTHLQLVEMSEPSENSNVVYLHQAGDLSASGDGMTLSTEEVKNAIIDNVIDEIAYLSDGIGFKTSAVWKDDALQIFEINADNTRSHAFSFVYLRKLKRCGLDFNGEVYLCEDGMFSIEKHSMPPVASVREGIYSERSSSGRPKNESGNADFAQAYVSIRDGVNRVLRTILSNDEKG